MAYVLGFFAADGYMTINKRGSCFINFHISDLPLLKRIRFHLKSNHKISHKRSLKGDGYRLQIGSKEMFKDLVKIGFGPNKTRNIKLPQMPCKYRSHFVRGYFDGDGNVWCGFSNTSRRSAQYVATSVFTSCSEGFLWELKSLLASVGLSGGSLVKSKGNYYRLSYSVNDTLKLYKFMYNGMTFKKQALFLRRKLRIFEKFIRMRS